VNHWPFIIAAYAVTLVPVAALVLASWSSMRRAEAAAEELKR
jgi:heme exporter protein CcmD